MKIIYYNLIIILLLSAFTLTKEECQDDEISISGLGKCKKISEILGNVDLKFKTSNLLYLASNEDGKMKVKNIHTQYMFTKNGKCSAFRFR